MGGKPGEASPMWVEFDGGVETAQSSVVLRSIPQTKRRREGEEREGSSVYRTTKLFTENDPDELVHGKHTRVKDDVCSQ